MRTDILNYQRRFYINARNEARRDKNKAIILGTLKDKVRIYHFAKMLERQHIKYNALKQSLTINGKRFNKDNSIIIPLQQKNYRMIKAMFEKRTHFKDSLFYDVSAWTLPLAFNMDYTFVNSTTNLGAPINNMVFNKGKLSKKSNYAYLFEWHNYNAPSALQAILNKGLRAKVALKSFSINGKTFDHVTIMIPVKNQTFNATEIAKLMTKLA